MTEPVLAYLGLGANLDAPGARLRAVIDELQGHGTPPGRVSSLYRSAPVGYAAQPEFVNAVVELRALVPARELLDALLALEVRHGRVRSFANAPRRLDLDLLLYGDAVIDEPGLQVPHPRMHERRFVLEPLCELAPACVIPGRGPARQWLARSLDQPVERIK